MCKHIFRKMTIPQTRPTWKRDFENEASNTAKQASPKKSNTHLPAWEGELSRSDHGRTSRTFEKDLHQGRFDNPCHTRVREHWRQDRNGPHPPQRRPHTPSPASCRSEYPGNATSNDHPGGGQKAREENAPSRGRAESPPQETLPCASWSTGKQRWHNRSKVTQNTSATQTRGRRGPRGPRRDTRAPPAQPVSRGGRVQEEATNMRSARQQTHVPPTQIEALTTTPSCDKKEPHTQRRRTLLCFNVQYTKLPLNTTHTYTHTHTYIHT